MKVKFGMNEEGLVTMLYLSDDEAYCFDAVYIPENVTNIERLKDRIKYVEEAEKLYLENSLTSN